MRECMQHACAIGAVGRIDMHAWGRGYFFWPKTRANTGDHAHIF
jgi:hypothetical protein